MKRISGILILSPSIARDNFVVLYELFDEMMDFGYPQVFSLFFLSIS